MVDGYPESFSTLTGRELPRLMECMRREMKSPMKMIEFNTSGVGEKTILRKIGAEYDFRGCYVLLERDKPLYVGISKRIVKRLMQHVRGTTHFDASLAYRMANEEIEFRGTRAAAMQNMRFLRRFNEKREYIASLNVAITEIQNPLVTYIFEAYCAMELKTTKWNTFDTH